MPCDRCSSTFECHYFLFTDETIHHLCYDCCNLYDRLIASKLLKQATHFLDIFTGVSYPF
jgi:hypothetical protein